MGPGSSWSEFGLAESYFYHNLVLSPKPGFFNFFSNHFFFFHTSPPPRKILSGFTLFFKLQDFYACCAFPSITALR